MSRNQLKIDINVLTEDLNGRAGLENAPALDIETLTNVCQVRAILILARAVIDVAETIDRARQS